jgi:anthraniloyl-CoA monooxygenase
MKIVCVGGGPAGLYFAISAKLRNAEHDITIIERNRAGVTHGWGVGYWDDVLDSLYYNDPVSARQIQDASGVWDGVEVHVSGKQPAYLGGYGLSMGRQRLLDILTKRAIDLGVDIQFQHEVKDPYELPAADLIAASDGVNSRTRQLFKDHYQTHVELGRNKYLWLGVHKVFDAFRYIFEKTPAGWIWLHAYYLDAERSTCVVECSPETWEKLGFHELSADQSMKLLAQIFERHLDGRALINQMRSAGPLPWLNFRIISNRNWYHDNVVLLGDAAHTTHFSIGSGTRLAIGDAITLAAKLDEHSDLRSALRAYAEERRAILIEIQRQARNSMLWLENVTDYIEQDNVQFAHALSKRLGLRQPLWRYYLHLATQLKALRTLRRNLRARRRTKIAYSRQRHDGDPGTKA